VKVQIEFVNCHHSGRLLDALFPEVGVQCGASHRQFAEDRSDPALPVTQLIKRAPALIRMLEHQLVVADDIHDVFGMNR
jgi:hypothetical protein